jgi:hypothetical protein
MSYLYVTEIWPPVYWTYQESLYTITSTLEGGGMLAVLQRDMAIGPIGPTPSSLLHSNVFF